MSYEERNGNDMVIGMIFLGAYIILMALAFTIEIILIPKRIWEHLKG